MKIPFTNKQMSILNLIIPMFLLFTILLYHWGIFSPIENTFYDLRFKFRGFLKPKGNIVIIKIDEESLNELGRWPWDRKILAQGVKNLFNAGVKVVALDIIFPQPSTIESDLALANSLKKGNAVLATHFEETFENVVVGERIEKRKVETPLLPTNVLRNVGRMGYTNVYPDDDGVTRTLLLEKYHQGIKYKSFDKTIAEVFLGKEITDVPESIYLNYYGPSEYTDSKSKRILYTYNNYSFLTIYKNIIPSIWLKDKIVLIGATATATYDHYPSPYQKTFPGVEIHANVIENILSKTYLTKIEEKYYIIFLVVLTIFVAIIFHKVHPIFASVLVVLCTLGYYAITVLLFIKARFVMDFVPCGFIIVSVGFINIINKVMLEKQEKKMLKGIFSRYLSPQVMTEILDNPEMVGGLGGKKRVITIMFTDIRSFTSMSEQLSPEEVVSILNEYLEVMSSIVFKYSGTVDKYIGDAVMCFWNAPVEQADHAERAVNCALEMLRELENLNKVFEQKGKPKLSIGAGINTGEAIVGNIGSTKLMEYTAIGDTVNTASRLQSLTKEYLTPIVISEFTYNLIKDKIECSTLGNIKIRGKAVEIGIFKINSAPPLIIPH